MEAALRTSWKGSAMTSSDQKTQARKLVSQRLRVFFSQLQQQLAASTDALRRRIEAKIAGGKTEP